MPKVSQIRYASLPPHNYEENLYFYHSDHLGSSSWITDAGGDVNQYLQYLPLRQAQSIAFGESFVSQTSTSWQSRYTFSGKEKDEETGYRYFGARYYDSDLSVWLSVVPIAIGTLAGKYPSMSAYMYCAGNPVMLDFFYLSFCLDTSTSSAQATKRNKKSRLIFLFKKILHKT